MHTLDTTGIFEPHLPQDIALPFEEVLNTPAIRSLFFYKKYPLSEQQRRCQIPSNLSEVTLRERRIHGPSWFTRPFFSPNEEQFRRIYGHFEIPLIHYDPLGSELAFSAIWVSEYPPSRQEEVIPAAWLGRRR